MGASTAAIATKRMGAAVVGRRVRVVLSVVSLIKERRPCIVVVHGKEYPLLNCCYAIPDDDDDDFALY